MLAAIIVNRRAGRMRRDPKLAERIRAACARTCGQDARLYLTSDLEELTSVAQEIAALQPRVVGIVGGDGTCSFTLTALWRAYGSAALPHIAFLRGGTMNTIASSLGISSRKPLALLRSALHAAQAPEQVKTRERPTMQVGETAASERLGFLFGTGVWYGYLAEAYADGPPTRMTNAAVLARVLASAAVEGETYKRILQSQPLSVHFADGQWDMHSYLTIAAGTVAHAGFGFRPFPHAFERSDAFQLLAVTTGPRALLRDFPGMLIGQGLRPQTAHQTITTYAELRAVDGASFGYSVDGEVDTAETALRINLGPSVRFLCI